MGQEWTLNGKTVQPLVDWDPVGLMGALVPVANESLCYSAVQMHRGRLYLRVINQINSALNAKRLIGAKVLVVHPGTGGREFWVRPRSDP